MRRPGSTGGSWATEPVATFRWMPAHRRGVAAGVAADLLWGLFPLYWPLLEPAAPVEILAHRIAWSLVLLVGLLAPTAGLGWTRGGGGLGVERGERPAAGRAARPRGGARHHQLGDVHLRRQQRPGRRDVAGLLR